MIKITPMGVKKINNNPSPMGFPFDGPNIPYKRIGATPAVKRIKPVIVVLFIFINNFFIFILFNIALYNKGVINY